MLAKPGTGHNQTDGRLTPEQKELVWQHCPKIKKEAKKYSGGNPILLEDLLTVGMDRAYDLARKFNPNQGVTFGKFIEKYLWGAMRDHAKRARKIVSGLDQDKIDRLYFGRVATPAKKPDQIDSKKRWSKADRRTSNFFKGERIYSGRGREVSHHSSPFIYKIPPLFDTFSQADFGRFYFSNCLTFDARYLANIDGLAF
jgi:hypothetical protein